MKDLTVEELKNRFTYKQLEAYNSEIRSKYNDINFKYSYLLKNQETIIENEVKRRTKELEDTHKKELEEKDKQIEALKEKIARMQSIMDNDSTNPGIPTSKTAIGKTKHIPNTREKTGRSKGAPKGHSKHQLKPFSDEEVTEIVEIAPTKCNKCHSTNIEKLDTSVDKQELDYEVVLVKRKNKFINYKCSDCGNVFHAPIPNDLKENIQYGKTLQSLAVCLTNEIYTPFNKTVKLVQGITNGEINMSEGYVTKLQKRASKNLETFIEEVKEYIPKQEVYGWDDGVVKVNCKDAILRTYCTDNVALFIGHEKKDEDSLAEDGILLNTRPDTIVMHDHILHNYNDKYSFENVECMIHLVRRLKKKKEQTEHEWCDNMIKLLSNTNKDRNQLFKEGKDAFEPFYIKQLDENYDKTLSEAKEENEDKTKTNYYEKEEKNFINDLIKYKKNYLLWAYDFRLPSTNNNSERNIRPIKSKMKISGQFQSLSYLQYYADIRTYIETCKKNGINIIEACIRLMNGNPYTLKEILGDEKNSE